MSLIKTAYRTLFSFGSISFAAFAIAAVTGIFLAIPFDVKNPYDSISLMLLANPAASLLRSLHYWSAQTFLITVILHIWDHLRTASEKRIKKGIWLRLTFSILIIFFVMLSGFILKGDAESIQARSVFRSLLESIPAAGRSLAFSLLGPNNDYQIVYVHHIATAVIFLWLIISEHAKNSWPKMKTISVLLPLLLTAAFFFTPLLHDSSSSAVKGPWYMTGLQEIFHWLNYPQMILPLVIILLAAFYYLRHLNDKWSVNVKKTFLLLFSLYMLICVFAIVFRGEDWKFSLPWKSKNITGIKFDPGFSFRYYFNSADTENEIPVVLGRREGCLYCHNDIKGLTVSHDPKSIGCFSCHFGDPFTLDKLSAHEEMILIPGDVETAGLSCGSQNCHPDIPGRVRNSLMNTMSGVISVDKFVFGENFSLNSHFNLKDLENSAADNHLRNLCASCHTGNKKDSYGPVTELTRGGGCNACHLQYSNEALNELKASLNGNNIIKENAKISNHPSLTIKVTDDNCFGCHSRSGRIALNYQGWHETQLSAEGLSSNSGFRLLEDGRVLSKVQPDVHFENGMSCIDCHIAKEIMGDGNVYSHKEDQIIIQCTDCHTNKFNTFEKEKPDLESEKLLTLRNFPVSGKNKIIYTLNGNIPLLNARTDSTEHGFLITKNTAQKLPLKPPAPECITGKAHERLSCTACHSSWAHQCIGCHTEYKPEMKGYDLLSNKDIKGQWEEKPGDFLSEAPVLGVRTVTDNKGHKKEIITDFIPGMIMTLDKSEFQKKDLRQGTLFRRLHAPAFSHTITKKARSCASCHLDPLALGFGRGELKYNIKNSKGRWTFKPKYNLVKNDNLPEDAWTGFLIERKDISSTRPNARPFSIEEQKKILTAGSCFFCHKPESFFIKKYLTNKHNTVLSKSCVLPLW